MTTTPIIDIPALSQLDAIAYAKTREASAKAIGVSVLVLDKAIKDEQAKQKALVKAAAQPLNGLPSPELGYSMKMEQTGDYTARTGVIFKWQGTHWEAQKGKELESEALHYLVTVAPDKANDRLAKSAVATAALYLPKLPIPPKMGLYNAPVIPTKSGYLLIDGDSITLKPSEKSDGMTYVLDCGYDKDALCPKFNAFLNEALPNSEIRDYLQEYAGYTLLSDTRHEIAAWLIGEGGTGKGTVGVVMQGIHRKVVALNLEQINQYTMSSLVDASLVYVDETPTGRINEQTIKTAISGDLMTSDVKNRDPIDFEPTAKWIINGNHLPPLSDHTSGFWRRFIIFPFNAKPKVKIPMLAETIVETELEGVLNWALAGLQRLIKRGHFAGLPEEMQRIKDNAITNANSVASWLDECEVKVVDDKTTSKDIVYRAYRDFCEKNGNKAVSANTFWQRLPAINDKISISRPRINGVQVPSCNMWIPSAEF